MIRWPKISQLRNFILSDIFINISIRVIPLIKNTNSSILLIKKIFNYHNKTGLANPIAR